jgi:hypothetical protein
MPGSGLKETRRRRRRDSEGDGTHLKKTASKTAVIAWSAILMLAALSVVAFFLVVWLRGQMSRKASTEQAAVPVQKIIVSEFPSPSEEESLDMVKRALAIRNPAEVEKYFRLLDTDPADVVAFLDTMHEKDGAITGYQWLSSMDANHMLLDGVLIKSLLDDKPRNRIAFLTPDDQGTWKVDFDALARTVQPSWETLISQEGGKGVVRVFIANDSYYNGPFSNEDEWTCYGMASPDTEIVLLGYCRKDTPQAHAMERIFRKENDETDEAKQLNRATLELRRPNDANPRQFEITGVLAQDWVLGDKAFDARVGESASSDAPPLRKSPEP